MRILIANPNMTQRMTDMMVDEARRYCRPDTEIAGVSAEFGIPYIATRSEIAIAGYALLDCLARHHVDFDAVVVGAFCPTLVEPAKELMPIPVLGIAEASMRAALLFGRRISIIGMGRPDSGVNQELIQQLGMQSDVVSVRALDLSGTDLAEQQEDADTEVIRQGRAAIREDGADVVILGGAAFAGMAERIAKDLPVPVVSPIPHAVSFLETAVRTGWRKPSEGTYRPPGEKATKGLSPELAAFFVSGG
jgi:Asp/Glu/hydantoin racemase